jgi:ABC-type phosphate transport system permease subunit
MSAARVVVVDAFKDAGEVPREIGVDDLVVVPTDPSSNQFKWALIKAGRGRGYSAGDVQPVVLMNIMGLPLVALTRTNVRLVRQAMDDALIAMGARGQR